MSLKTKKVIQTKEVSVRVAECDYCGHTSNGTDLEDLVGWAEVVFVGKGSYDICPACVEAKGLKK